MAQFEFKLPDIGEGVVEGEIVKWLVKAGDEIAEDQPLVEVMTDKATVTIPSPRRGKVVKTVGNEGDIAKVHQTLVVLEVDAAPSAKAAAEAPKAADATISVPPQAGATPSLPPQHAGQPAPLQAAGAPQPGPGGNGDQRRVLATPVTRRMARE